MFGSQVLDIVIGLVLMYLMLSLVCSAMREALEAWLKTRAADLERGLRELLQDPDGRGVVSALYRHPLIYGLFRGEYRPGRIRETLPRGGNLPSYIPAASFAVALMDLVARGPSAVTAQPGAPTASTPGTPLSLDALRVAAARYENPAVQRALLTAIDTAQGDLDRAQANLEAWFNAAMDRVSGWYKRRTQNVIFVVGAVLTIAVNADTLTVTQSLVQNDALRKVVVAHAEAVARDSTVPPAAASRTVAAFEAELTAIGFPIGWVKEVAQVRTELGTPNADWCFACVWPVLRRNGVAHIPGWLLTAFAISLGAPFWFDTLNKVMVIRTTVKPHEKSPEEASQDRQRPAGTASGGP